MHIKLKGIMQQHLTHILLADTPPLKVNLGVGEMRFMFCDL